MFEKVPDRAGKVKLQGTDRLSIFRELSNVEKYIFLLETFWVDVDWTELQEERFHFVHKSVQDLFYFILKKLDGGINRLDKNLSLDEKIVSERLEHWNIFFYIFSGSDYGNVKKMKKHLIGITGKIGILLNQFK